MSQQPNPQPRPGPRRRPADRAQPGARRPLRERLIHPTRPSFKAPSKTFLRWSAGVVLLLAIAIAVLIAIWDWNWFRGPVERIASARTHRQVTISGDLNANIWSWQPWATVDGVHIANPSWAGGKEMANVGRIKAQVKLLPLLRGRVDLPLLRFDNPNAALFADAQGRKNWDFSDGRDDKPMKLPPIRNFIINNGHVSYINAERRLRFEGVINAAEELGGQNRGFGLVGTGTINGAPFRMDVTGGPLINIKRDEPYPFDAEVHAGATSIVARGAIPQPFDMGQFYTTLAIRGPDMAALFPLTGIALPNTPPYNLRARLTRDGLTFRMDDIDGRVGDSDLSGVLSVVTEHKRPFLKANLKSNSLDFDDLGAIFGGSPSVGPGETASPEQKAMHAKLAAQQRVLPDATLDVKRIRAMDADVTYRALSIRDAPIKLASGSARVKLNDGVLKIDPVALELPRGRVAGAVGLDARKSPPVTNVDLRLTNARVEASLPMRFDGAPPITGALVGRAKLTGAGDTLHKAFGGASGQVVVVMPGGEVKKAFAELAGSNVIKGLGLLHKSDTTPIRCAVASFDTRQGLMRADQIVVDTGPVLIRGHGTVNLDTERMDFRFKGKDKKFRLVRVLLPIKVTGPLTAPSIGIEPGAAIAQGAGGITLGSLLTPLAAILPFVDPGLAKNADCAGLLAEAGRQGAPLSSAR